MGMNTETLEKLEPQLEMKECSGWERENADCVDVFQKYTIERKE